MWGKEVVLILFCVLGLDVVLGGALCFGLCYGLLCGIWAVLRILFVCALGLGVVLGGALCFGLYSGFRRGTWDVLRVLDCIWDFGVGIGRCLYIVVVLWIIVFVLGGALCFVVLEG